MDKNFVTTITSQQAEKFKCILSENGWELSPFPPYAYWKAKKNKSTIVAYTSGKLTIQGKETSDIITFLLEPHITGILNLEDEVEVVQEKNITPHAGVDESGKGDFFGPLVIASCFVNQETAPQLIKIGVTDSKLIKNDKKIIEIAAKIKRICHNQFNVVIIGNEAYNSLYDKFQNLNHLLAWGHARTIENLLEIVPECQHAISDKFGSAGTIKKALLEKGKKIKLEEFTKAESDIAVAAASILARAEFVIRMSNLSEKYQITIPKGASGAIEIAGRKIVQKFGEKELNSCAKLHFKTTKKILGS